MTTSTARLSDVLEHAARLQRAALDQLSAVSGDDSLCTISRSGSPRPAVKYHEGAVAALARARRAVDGLDSRADAAAAVIAVRERWTAHGGVGTTTSWRAYLDGGVDALDNLLETSRNGTHTDRPAGAAPSPVPDALAAVPSIEATSTLSVLARRARAEWPRRRSIVAVALAPVLFVALVTGAGGWMLHTPVWTALVALVSVAGAAVLASYLPGPGQGWRFNVGCTPCAAVSAVTVIGAGAVLQSAPREPLMVLAALGLVTFGLLQRLTRAGTSCAS